MKTISLKIEDLYLKGLKILVKNGVFPNVSEAIRVAIRDLLKKELWNDNALMKLIDENDSS